MTVLLTRVFLLVCLLASPSALGQTYPDRNVTIVVTSAAGALTDVLTRAVAQQLSEMWKQSVIVENRGGAGYSIAAQSVMRAEHDGYTLLASETGFYTTQPHLYAKDKLPYDAEKDFVPVAGYGTIPTALLVNPSVPVNSVGDLIALAKTKPAAVTFGTAGIGTALHIAALELENLAGIKMTAVHYRGAAPALTDVIAGHVNAVIMGPSVALSSVKDGKLKMLAFGSEKRVPQFPDVPTIAETVRDTRRAYRSGCLPRRARLRRSSRRSTPTCKRSSAIPNSRRSISNALRCSRYLARSMPLPNIYARIRPNAARSSIRRTLRSNECGCASCAQGTSLRIWFHLQQVPERRSMLSLQSDVLTALNLLPAMAMLALVNRPISRQRALGAHLADRRPIILAKIGNRLG